MPIQLMYHAFQTALHDHVNVAWPEFSSTDASLLSQSFAVVPSCSGGEALSLRKYTTTAVLASRISLAQDQTRQGSRRARTVWREAIPLITSPSNLTAQEQLCELGSRLAGVEEILVALKRMKEDVKFYACPCSILYFSAKTINPSEEQLL